MPTPAGRCIHAGRRIRALTLTLLALGQGPSLLAQAQGPVSCTAESLNNPFGTGTRAVAEYKGQFYEAGFIHAHRQVSGNWTDFIGGLVGSEAVNHLGEFDGSLIVAGNYGRANGLIVNNIAAWDGTSFSAFGSGLGGGIDEVSDTLVFNGELYAAGSFENSGSGDPLGLIARWDGTSWQRLGTGLSTTAAGFTAEVTSMVEYQGDLYATGRFRFAGTQEVNGLARWDGNQWHAVGTGLTALTPEGNNIGLGTALAVYKDKLYIAGFFDRIGDQPFNFAATWDGSAFADVPGVISHAIGGMQTLGDFLIFAGLQGLQTSNGVFELGYFDGEQWFGLGNSNANFMWDFKPLKSDPGSLLIGSSGSGLDDGINLGSVFILRCQGFFNPIFSDGFETADTSAWSQP